MDLNKKTKEDVLTAQRSEITEHLVYKNLANSMKDQHNKEVLFRISNDEMRHYNFFRSYSGVDLEPDGLKVFFYTILSKIFGMTFAVKLMENGEDKAQNFYEGIAEYIPDIKDILEDEMEHEKKIIDMLEEEKLKYVGSVVLGLNDALVELTGALAGLTFSLQNSNLVAVTGLITGIAASFSMAGSEYLSTKSETLDKNPFMAALYTGFAYLITVFLLIAPYLFIKDIYVALPISIVLAIFVIFVFNFYISVVQNVSFKERFLEMLSISLGVAFLSFIVGIAVRKVFNINL